MDAANLIDLLVEHSEETAHRDAIKAGKTQVFLALDLPRAVWPVEAQCEALFGADAFHFEFTSHPAPGAFFWFSRGLDAQTFVKTFGGEVWK